MALLFQDVGLRLPFPNEQLTELRGSKSKPFACLVDSDKIDIILGDASEISHTDILNFNRTHT